jgi:putative endonuclease
MKYGGAVYIMTNRRNGALYVGVTSDLRKRAGEHSTKVYPDSFTIKYGCSMLVYYCTFPRIEDAIAEEKRIKSCDREAKIKLIEDMNPEWKDLLEEI